MRSGDVFILSKGHAAPAFYAVLEKHGYSPDVTKRHPDRDTKNGIIITSGSLGHGLPIAIGIALGKKLRSERGLVSVLLGDMETQEGTTHESIGLIKQLQLNNLAVHVDNNEGLNESSIGIIHYTEKKYPHSYIQSEQEYEETIR